MVWKHTDLIFNQTDNKFSLSLKVVSCFDVIIDLSPSRNQEHTKTCSLMRALYETLVMIQDKHKGRIYGVETLPMGLFNTERGHSGIDGLQSLITFNIIQ